MLVKTNKYLDDNKEYLAIYVPKIEIESEENINSNQNSICNIPNAKAYFQDKKINVEISVINPNGEEIDYENNEFILGELGNYLIVYKVRLINIKLALVMIPML